MDAMIVDEEGGGGGGYEIGEMRAKLYVEIMEKRCSILLSSFSKY